MHLDFVTDIITNSSSVVYTQAVNEGGVYKLIQEVLKAVGVDSDAKDLFVVSIAHDIDVITERAWNEPEEYGIELPDGFGNLSWKEKSDFIDGEVSKKLADGTLDLDIDDDSTDNTYYTVTDKLTGKPTTIGDLLNGLFESGEYYG